MGKNGRSFWCRSGEAQPLTAGLPSAPPLASPADHCCRQCVDFLRPGAGPSQNLRYFGTRTISPRKTLCDQPFTRSAVGSAADPYGPAPARLTCRTCAEARPTRLRRVRRLDGASIMSGTLGSCLMCASPFGRMSRSACHLNAVTLLVCTVSGRGIAQLLDLSAFMRACE